MRLVGHAHGASEDAIHERKPFDCGVSERARGLLTVLTAMGGASRSGARPPPPKTAVRRAMLLLGGGALLLACAVGRPGGAGVPAEREQSTGAGTAAG